MYKINIDYSEENRWILIYEQSSTKQIDKYFITSTTRQLAKDASFCISFIIRIVNVI